MLLLLLFLGFFRVVQLLLPSSDVMLQKKRNIYRVIVLKQSISFLTFVNMSSLCLVI
jgi:hypothetical protein